MKGYLTSYVGMFDQPIVPGRPVVSSVVIPMIQRDYAQGRPDERSREIRLNFLEALLDPIAGGPVLGLDFVYGRMDGATLYPLDGQQRLTTLFLLHWYLASRAGSFDPAAPWLRFTYATRSSARRFCEELGIHPLPDGEEPAAWIVDQPWFQHGWRNDATIEGMLAMLSAIESELAKLHPNLDLSAAWARLSDIGSPVISFYLLPLDDMESDEDLYIKMNSRGKPLTQFENFKARFEHDIRYADEAKEFVGLIDGAWSNLFWPYRGDNDIVDEELMNYLDFVTELCELSEGHLGSGPLGSRAREVFGETNPSGTSHLAFLLDAFNTWLQYDDVPAVFDGFFSKALPGEEGYDPEKVVLFTPGGTDLFAQCLASFDSQKSGNRTFSLQQSLLLYAVLLHSIEPVPDFPRRLRRLRNLIAASEFQIRREFLPGLAADVRRVIAHDDLTGLTRLSNPQVDDELLKNKLLSAHPELADVVFRLEDHPILRGTLSVFALEPDGFAERAAAFELAFADPSNWLSLTGALLATGDYQRQRPNSHAWQFGTSSPVHAQVWRYLLAETSRDGLDATRKAIETFLDGLAASHLSVADYCAQITGTWLTAREAEAFLDWRYYLVKYPSMRGGWVRDGSARDGVTGIYYGEGATMGYSLAMLRTYYLNGYYRDPFLLELWRASGADDKVRDPSFTGYPSTPRWLRLAASLTGWRAMPHGFELEAPDEPKLRAAFDDICSAQDHVTLTDGGAVLDVPQAEHDGTLVDTVNRIELGAALLKSLVAAGL